MEGQVRAWKLLRSLQLALIVGGLLGLIAVGLTYNNFVGNLTTRDSLLIGAGVTVGVTLILTYVFDQLSKTAQNVANAAKGKKKK
jgi:hypothetical protein